MKIGFYYACNNNITQMKKKIQIWNLIIWILNLYTNPNTHRDFFNISIKTYSLDFF